MERILFLAAIPLVTASVLGQGTLAFNTVGGGVNAPCTNILTGTRVSGTGFLAQLFWAPGVSTDYWQFVAVTNPPAHFGTDAFAGYVTSASGGGNRILPVPGGTVVTAQIRMWDAFLGSTWEVAFNNWLTAPFGPTLGWSGLVTVTVTEVPDPPALLRGLQPWYVGPIPEPRLALLLTVGLAVLWLKERRPNRV
jgi:hypothetical protein